MDKINVINKTQHYIHAHILFKATNIDFLEEWLKFCKISNGENWDESVLNCMYWKYNLQNHYLPIIDPYYKIFYRDQSIIFKVITIHGCKKSNEHEIILNKMIDINNNLNFK